MMGLRLSTQPPEASVLSTATVVTMSAKMTQPIRPVSAMACRRSSMLPDCWTTAASKVSCRPRASLSSPYM